MRLFDRTRYAIWAGVCLAVMVAVLVVLNSVETPPPPTAMTAVVVRSNVPGAEVFVDGNSKKGASLEPIPVPAGRAVQIQLRKDGYPTATTTVEVEEGQTRTVELKLCRPKAERRCEGTTVRWFDDCGAAGEVAESCAAGKVCKGDQCVDPPRECAQRTCQGNAVFCIDGAGKQFADPEQACAAGQVCREGQCREFDPCQSRRCDGRRVLCVDSEGKLAREPAETCKVDQQCLDGACVDVPKPCQSRVCVGEAIHCVDSAGVTSARPEKTCRAGKERCEEGKCVAVDPPPTTVPPPRPCVTRKCVGKQVFCVDENGRPAGKPEKTCSADESCSDGKCVTVDKCAQKKCVGQQIFCVDGNGATAAQAQQTCTDTQQCSDGRCVEVPQCVSERCVGNQVFCFDGRGAQAPQPKQSCGANQTCSNGKCADVVVPPPVPPTPPTTQTAPKPGLMKAPPTPPRKSTEQRCAGKKHGNYCQDGDIWSYECGQGRRAQDCAGGQCCNTSKGAQCWVGGCPE